MTLKELLELFCNNTSLRGVAKTIRAPTRLLRFTWTAYVLLMLTALITCVTFIVKDYLEYKTIIQTTLLINDESHNYPALTLCSHYPFSESAHKLWADGHVLTPTNFSRLVRRKAWAAFNDSELGMAELIATNDRKRIYYQSLEHSDALRIGFSAQQMFIFCVHGNGPFMTIGESQNCGLIVKRISLPSFFNCFQVQANSRLDWLTLILHVVQSGQSKYEEAFVHDIFEQAYGIRLQIHENDTYPDPAGKGIHVEPGKLIEVSYRHVRWHEAGVPGDPCVPLEQAKSLRVRDLKQSFAYSVEGCLKEAIGLYTLRRCGCYLADYLRQDFPNSTHPYCGDARLSRRQIKEYVSCLSQIQYNEMKVTLSRTRCPNPCSFSEYETFTSQTVWKSTQWQLHWLLQQSRSLAHLQEQEEMLEAASTKLERDRILQNSHQAKQQLHEAFSATRLKNVSSDSFLPEHTAEFAYVTIRRRSRNTLQKTETLSLSISALMSRVGGLCSLFLGLTCAFVVELLELLLMCSTRGDRQQQQSRRADAVPAAGVDGQEEKVEREVKMPDAEEAEPLNSGVVRMVRTTTC